MTPDGVPPPPRWARRVVELVAPRDDVAALLDDLDELYRVRHRRDPSGAPSWYVRHACGSALRLAAHRITNWNGRGWDMLTRSIAELRAGARRLIRTPVFTAVSIATVGIGIGAFSAVFSVVDAVLLEPPPYEEPDDLVWLWRSYPWIDLPRGWLGGPDIVSLRAHDDVFEDVIALRSGQFNLSASDGGVPTSVQAILSSAGLFELLGVAPAHGRGFAPLEDRPGAARVVVLGHELWRSRFGADPSVVGTEVVLDGEPMRVVGVAPPDFRFVKHASLGEPEAADLYLPLRMDLASLNPGNGMFAGLARVRPGVAPDRVDAAASAVAADLDAQWGNPGLGMWAVGLVEDLTGRVRPALLTILGGAAFLLLVLGANLTTLMLGRAVARDRELALRSAIGAGRGRLLATVLSESLIIAGAGAVLGLLLAHFGVDALRALAPATLPRRLAIAVDGSVVGAAIALTLAMALAASLGPGLRTLRRRIAERLRHGGARGGDERRTTRTRGALVAAQMAISLTLLVGAGLLTQAFAGLLRADPGFDAERVTTFRIPLDPSRYTEAAQIVDFDVRFRERLRALPGVEAAGAANALPLSARGDQIGVSFPGAPGNTGDAEADSPLVDVVRVTPGYVQAAGLRLLRGRAFHEQDATDAPDVVLIDDVLAERFFPSGGAVGSRISLSGDTAAIVGIVDQARLYSVHSDDRGQVYRPMAQQVTLGLGYAVRAASGSLLTLAAARAALAQVDADLPVTQLRSMDSIRRSSLGRERLSLTLLGAFAVGALLLSTLGLYGVVANGVARRRHEMGVRLALGASRSQVVGLVLSQGLRLGLVGVLAGSTLALMTRGAVEGLVPGVDPGSPWVYLAAALGLLGVAAAASWLPARQATRIDPIEALRAD